jgi:hypothetical protein
MRRKAITIRNLPREVERAVQEKARKEGLSLNRAVAALLGEATGQRPAEKSAVHHDFDKYAGRWRKAEGDEFDASLKEQRRVDPADWK